MVKENRVRIEPCYFTYRNYYEKIGFKDQKIDTPFDIPSKWAWTRLGTLFNVVSASRVHQSDWKAEGIPFFRAREIGKLCDLGFVNNELFISKDLFSKLAKNHYPKPGDIMITAVGTLGKTYIVKNGDLFYYKDASVISLRNIHRLIPEFYTILFGSQHMKDQIEELSVGTTVGTITIEKCSKYLIPLPPSNEQIRIIKKIETINSIISY